MSTTLLRTRHCWYWLSPAGAVPLTLDARSTPAPFAGPAATLLADPAAVEGAVSRARRFGRPVPVESLDLLPPVARPCRVLAAYGGHRPHARPPAGPLARRLETRLRPTPADPLTVVLRSDDSLAGPGDPVLRPPHVRLLEQGVEVGLVVGRPIAAGTHLDDEAHDVVGGLVLAGSVLARDVELAAGHPVEASSYPSFTGLGRALVLVDRDELKRIVDLRLTVTVNGEVRQDVVLGDELVGDPLDALRAAVRWQRLDPGDLVLTGAPAAHAPGSRLDRAVDGLLEPARATRRALDRAAGDAGHLRDGDVVEVSAATGDGTLDLGSLWRVVVPA